MTLPAVTFPDVELWATDYLRTALAARPESYAANVYVGASTPKARRDRMVVVRRDGGPRLDATREAARLAVRVWGSSEQEASNLAQLVRALMGIAATGTPVARVTELSGPSPVADESGQALRYMTFELIVRGSDFS